MNDVKSFALNLLCLFFSDRMLRLCLQNSVACIIHRLQPHYLILRSSTTAGLHRKASEPKLLVNHNLPAGYESQTLDLHRDHRNCSFQARHSAPPPSFLPLSALLLPRHNGVAWVALLCCGRQTIPRSKSFLAETMAVYFALLQAQWIVRPALRCQK